MVVMPDEWIEATGWMVLVDEQLQPVVPREVHTYRWRVEPGGVEFEHMSPHGFDIPVDRPAFAVLVEDDNHLMIYGYRIPGGPASGHFLIEP